MNEDLEKKGLADASIAGHDAQPEFNAAESWDQVVARQQQEGPGVLEQAKDAVIDLFEWGKEQFDIGDQNYTVLLPKETITELDMNGLPTQTTTIHTKGPEYTGSWEGVQVQHADSGLSVPGEVWATPEGELLYPDPTVAVGDPGSLVITIDPTAIAAVGAALLISWATIRTINALLPEPKGPCLVNRDYAEPPTPYLER